MKKWLTRIIWIFVIVAILVLIYNGLDFLLTDDLDSMSRCTFHDYYAQDKIDTLFIGSSHSMYCIDTPQLSEKLDKSVFALTMSGMSYKQMYYTLKEVFRTNNVPDIYIALSPSLLTYDDSIDSATYLITDYMKSPVNRLGMIMATVEPESYINGMFRLRRTVQEVPGLEEIKEIVKGKLSEDYWTKASNIYLGRGNWQKTTSMGKPGSAVFYLDSGFFDDSDLHNGGISPVQLDSLRKCIELCRSHQACVHLYVPPFSCLYLMRMPGYTDIMQEIKKLALEYDISFIDMNYVKKEYLDLDLGDFFNPDHMNTAGSKKVASFLLQYMKDPSDRYFGDSFENGYHEEDGIIAIGYTRDFLAEDNTIVENSADYDPAKMSIGISAYPNTSVPVKIRLTKAAKDKETGKWIDAGEEIIPDKVDGAVAYYILPFDHYQSKYNIELSETDTGRILVTARTAFNMI